MKGEVLSSQHTLMIDKIQIDICFNFHSSELSIIIEGTEFTHYYYNPSFKTFNYINLMDLASKSLDYWRLKQQKDLDEKKRLAEMSQHDEWENW